MNVEIICLCQKTELGPNNQRSIIGIFDSKMAEGEPISIRPFLLVCAIRFYRKDRGIHSIQVLVRDQRGEVLFKSQIEKFEALKFSNDSLIFHYEAVQKPEPLTFGTYQFFIEIDGKSISHTPLYLAQGKF